MTRKRANEKKGEQHIQDATPRYNPTVNTIFFSHPIRNDIANVQHVLLAPPPVLLKRCPRGSYHGVTTAPRHGWQCRRGRRRRRTGARAPNAPGRMSQRREMDHLLLSQSVRMFAVVSPARHRNRQCPARVRKLWVAHCIRSQRNYPPRMSRSKSLGIILS